MLSGATEDERFFSLCYTIDEGDDPWGEASLIKANPGWGVSVQPDPVRAIIRQARNINPAQEAAAMTGQLNAWVGADNGLFSMRAWRECGNHRLGLDDFEGKPCHLAIDQHPTTRHDGSEVPQPRRASTE